MTIAAPRFHGFTRAVAQKLLCFEAKRNLTVRGFLVSIASDKALPISEDSQAGQRCQASSPITSALDLPSIAIAGSMVMVVTMIHHAYGAWAYDAPWRRHVAPIRSEEHTSELQSLIRSSSAVFCLKKHKSY